MSTHGSNIKIKTAAQWLNFQKQCSAHCGAVDSRTICCGCIKSLFNAEKRKEGAKLRRDILLYFNALRSSVVFLSDSLRLNFLRLIQPLFKLHPLASLTVGSGSWENYCLVIQPLIGLINYCRIKKICHFKLLIECVFSYFSVGNIKTEASPGSSSIELS